MSDIGDSSPNRNFISQEEGEKLEAEGKEVEWRPTIHDFFNLSYANYLVLNRTVLQSMPDEWQRDFVQMLAELTNEMGWAMELHPAINVRILKREPERLYNETETCPTCDGSGEDSDSKLEDGTCEECDGDGEIEVESDRFEEPEEVGYAVDPIPHYSRGRTRIPLASQSVEEVNDGHYQMVGAWMKQNHPADWHRIFGPQFEVGEQVEVVRHTLNHALPPILDEIEGLGFFTGQVTNIVPGSGNSLYLVNVAKGDENATLAPPDTVQVQLHVDQLRRP